MGLREAHERHERTIRELNEERAAALVRIGRTLESLISQLHALRDAWPGLGPRERPRGLAAYRELRRRAELYRWYLEVQREAIGMRHHHRLDEFYEIPGPLD